MGELGVEEPESKSVVSIGGLPRDHLTESALARVNRGYFKMGAKTAITRDLMDSLWCKTNLSTRIVVSFLLREDISLPVLRSVYILLLHCTVLVGLCICEHRAHGGFGEDWVRNNPFQIMALSSGAFNWDPNTYAAANMNVCLLYTSPSPRDRG